MTLHDINKIVVIVYDDPQRSRGCSLLKFLKDHACFFQKIPVKSSEKLEINRIPLEAIFVEFSEGFYCVFHILLHSNDLLTGLLQL